MVAGITNPMQRKDTFKNRQPGTSEISRLPEQIVPMLARPSRLPSPDNAYAFELKWDGIRAIAFIENGKLRLQSRNLLDMTARYPELQPLGAALPRKSLVLDGEIVALTEQGLPSFELLQSRMGLGDIDAVKFSMHRV